jgi:hypothetical protein
MIDHGLRTQALRLQVESEVRRFNSHLRRITVKIDRRQAMTSRSEDIGFSRSLVSGPFENWHRIGPGSSRVRE